MDFYYYILSQKQGPFQAYSANEDRIAFMVGFVYPWDSYLRQFLVLGKPALML
jgi:hypothetical protein